VATRIILINMKMDAYSKIAERTRPAELTCLINCS
jgi:hypothetical protein